MNQVFRALRILLKLFLILMMIILIGHFFWGIPAEITDRSATEGWVDHVDRITVETRSARINTSILLILLLTLFLFVIKKKI